MAAFPLTKLEQKLCAEAWMRAWLDFTCSVHIIQDDSKKSFFFLYRAPTKRCSFLQPVLVLLSAADSTQDPQIHRQPPCHLYWCANCNRLFAVRVTSLRCHSRQCRERTGSYLILSSVSDLSWSCSFQRRKKEANRKNTRKALLPLKNKKMKKWIY